MQPFQRLYVTLAATASPIWCVSLAIGQFPAVLELSELNGRSGFAINGAFARDRAWRVTAAGDLNDDGISDIAIGAVYARPPGLQTGQTSVVFGSRTEFPAVIELSSLDGSNGFRVNGIDAGDWSGYSLSGAGDVNGDGVDDLLIGAPGADLAANFAAGESTGESYVIFGRRDVFEATVRLGEPLDGSIGFTIKGARELDFHGGSVSGAGDINGDGLADMVIGAPHAWSDRGEAYILFGNTSFPSIVQSSALDAASGITIRGENPNDHAGVQVSYAGDIDGDGIDDIVIGAPGADRNGIDSAGASYVVFGSALQQASLFELGDLNGVNGFVIKGANAKDYSGATSQAAGTSMATGSTICSSVPYLRTRTDCIAPEQCTSSLGQLRHSQLRWI